MADTPILSSGPSGRPHRLAAAELTAAMVAVAVLAMPFGRVALPAAPGFLPAFGAMTVMSDLLTGTLLLSQARLARDRSLLRLGIAYVFAGMMLVPHLLAFPGVSATSPLIDGDASAIWLWSAWHGGFAVLVIMSLLGRSAPLHRGDVRTALAIVLMAVVAITVVVTACLSWLPTILVDDSPMRLNTLGIGPAILAASAAALCAAKRRLRDPLSLGLAVSLLAATLDVALTLFGGGRFTLGWYAAQCLSLVSGLTVLAAVLSELGGQARRVAEVNGQLEQLLRTDALTGVANRRAFDPVLALEWRRARREQTPISLLMIDIDQFKGFNDRYGHPAGDGCLRKVAVTVNAQVQRPADLAARLGGEEFVVLLPNTEEAGAATVAERMRASVASLRLTHEGSAVGHVTISVGVATRWPFDRSADERSLVEAADQALYRAKAAGRNAVSIAPFEAPALEVAT